MSTDWILPPLASLVVGLVFGAPALVPFLTMRSLAEERRLGTLETLLSAPINNLAIIFGKWTASFIFYLFIALGAFCFPAIICLWFPEQANTLGFNHSEQWLGSFVFLLAFGASFTAIGIFASSVTKNQMVAGMLTFTLLALYLSVMTLSFSDNLEGNIYSGFNHFLWACFGSMFNGLNEMQSFSVGLIDIQTILHQIIVMLYFLALASSQLDQVRI